jgi:hypothetical protein
MLPTSFGDVTVMEHEEPALVELAWYVSSFAIDPSAFVTTNETARGGVPGTLLVAQSKVSPVGGLVSYAKKTTLASSPDGVEPVIVG